MLFVFCLLHYAGVGVGLMYSPSIVVVNQHFEKRRGLANGVSLAGSGVGSITIPPIMVYALHTYGLEGTLLLMGGMALNICVCGMLFRPPSFYMRRHRLKMERRRMMCKTVLHAGTNQPLGDANGIETTDALTEGCVNPVAIEDICLGEDATSTRSVLSLHKNQAKEIDNGTNNARNGTKEERQPNHLVFDHLCGGDCHSDEETKSKGRNDATTDQASSNVVTTNDPKKNDTEPVGVSTIDVDTHTLKSISLNTDLKGKPCHIEQQYNKKQPLFEYRLLTSPLLLIYCASIATAGSVYFDMFIMATPHAEQLGFNHTKAALLVSIMGGADMISRVGLGVFADSKIIKTQHLFHASLALSSVVLFILPSLKTYAAVASALVLFSVAGGGYISLLPTLLAEMLGVERMSTTFGIAVLTCGVGDLITPAVMGKYISISSHNNCSN